MYLFARDYLLKGVDLKIIVFFSAVFSIIPLYPLYGLSVMGQPLIFWAFLNLSYGNVKMGNWLVIVFFPFYAHFAMIAPFILVVLAIYGFYRFFSKDNPSCKFFFLGLALLTLCFVLANFITIKTFLFPGDYTSHRESWVAEPYSLIAAIKKFIITFFSGQYHSSAFIAIPIFLFGLFTMCYYRKDRGKSLLLALLLVLIGIISFINAVYPFLAYYFQKSFHIILTFQFNRFTFFIPFLWFSFLGVSVLYMIGKTRTFAVYLVIAVQAFFIVLQNNELKNNYSKIFSGKNNSEIINSPSFKSFFATDLFSQISKTINKPHSEYRVVSLGMHPSVAQFNGFFTLDSYQNNYPLSYKNQFRKVIEKELEIDDEIRKIFDNWGSRCYLYSHELKDKTDFGYLKNSNFSIENLSINTLELKKMGGEYILSTVPIANHDELQMNFINKFTHSDTHWEIYLYNL
jgi:MFS family permease